MRSYFLVTSNSRRGQPSQALYRFTTIGIAKIHNVQLNIGESPCKNFDQRLPKKNSIKITLQSHTLAHLRKIDNLTLTP